MISLFVGVIIVSKISYIILQDRRIDKELNSKGIKRSELKNKIQKE